MEQGSLAGPSPDNPRVRPLPPLRPPYTHPAPSVSHTPPPVRHAHLSPLALSRTAHDSHSAPLRPLPATRTHITPWHPPTPFSRRPPSCSPWLPLFPPLSDPAIEMTRDELLSNTSLSRCPHATALAFSGSLLLLTPRHLIAPAVLALPRLTPPAHLWSRCPSRSPQPRASSLLLLASALFAPSAARARVSCSLRLLSLSRSRHLRVFGPVALLAPLKAVNQ